MHLNKFPLLNQLHKTTGNLNSLTSCVRKPKMDRPGFPIQSSSSSSDNKPINIDELPDYSCTISLSSDQYPYASQAVASLKDKFANSSVVRNEFEFLQQKRIRASEMARLCNVALNDENLSKNRYTDVIPFDSSKVVLDSSGGYINASFVNTLAENAPRFIATQGPLWNTLEDFWKMVFQCRASAIVMLTQLVDQFKMVKCADYFQSEDGRREFGNISIATKWIKTTKNSLVLRLLEVTKSDSEEPPLSVLHIQYTAWPDHGVPRNTVGVREILKKTFHLPPGPIVVHCSAGIGRTGAYCTAHDAIHRILAGDLSALDFSAIVEIFRSQRLGMVQTMEQYAFSYKVVIDLLEELISEYNAGKNGK